MGNMDPELSANGPDAADARLILPLRKALTGKSRGPEMNLLTPLMQRVVREILNAGVSRAPRRAKLAVARALRNRSVCLARDSLR